MTEEIEITAIGDDVRKFLNTNTGNVRQEPYRTYMPNLRWMDGTVAICSMCGAGPGEPHRGCILR